MLIIIIINVIIIIIKKIKLKIKWWKSILQLASVLAGPYSDVHMAGVPVVLH